MLKSVNIIKVSSALIEGETHYDPWVQSILVPVFVNKYLLKQNHTHSFIHPLLLNPTMAELSRWDEAVQPTRSARNIFYLAVYRKNVAASALFIYSFLRCISLFAHLSLAVLGLCCVGGLSLAVASLAVEHGL